MRKPFYSIKGVTGVWGRPRDTGVAGVRGRPRESLGCEGGHGTHWCVREGTGVGWCSQQLLRQSKERNKIRMFWTCTLFLCSVPVMVVLAPKWELQVLWLMDWSVSWASLYFYPLLYILGQKCPFCFLEQNRTNHISSPFKQKAAVLQQWSTSTTCIFFSFITVMPLCRK